MYRRLFYEVKLVRITPEVIFEETPLQEVWKDTGKEVHLDWSVKQNLVMWAILWKYGGIWIDFYSVFNNNIKLPNFMTTELQFDEYKQLLQDIQINNKHSSTQYEFLRFDECIQ